MSSFQVNLPSRPKFPIVRQIAEYIVYDDSPTNIKKSLTPLTPLPRLEPLDYSMSVTVKKK